MESKENCGARTNRGWYFLCGASFLLSAAAIVLAAVIGACPGGIETAAGSQVPMKCYWTEKAVILMSVLPALLSLIQMKVKEKNGRAALSAALFLSAVLIIILTTGAGIGVCAGEGMRCAAMALAVRIDMILLAISAGAQLIYALGKSGKPKRGFSSC